jgi:hypothetical protein
MKKIYLALIAIASFSTLLLKLLQAPEKINGVK